jgi:hypothetical protein
MGKVGDLQIHLPCVDKPAHALVPHPAHDTSMAVTCIWLAPTLASTEAAASRQASKCWPKHIKVFRQAAACKAAANLGWAGAAATRSGEVCMYEHSRAHTATPNACVLDVTVQGSTPTTPRLCCHVSPRT